MHKKKASLQKMDKGLPFLRLQQNNGLDLLKENQLSETQKKVK